MRAVVQRVRSARVLVGERIVRAIGPGLLVFLGIRRGDGEADARWLAGRIRDLRLFRGPDGRDMDRSVAETGGGVLVVSQFTLYGDVRRGRRPSFDEAAPAGEARPCYERLVHLLRDAGLAVSTGEFQATMQVELVNDGPVTILLETSSADGAADHSTTEVGA